MDVTLSKVPQKSFKSGKGPFLYEKLNWYNLNLIIYQTSYFENKISMNSHLEFYQTTTYQFLKPHILKIKRAHYITSSV